MKIRKGNLLDMADNGDFDIILHGCNCFNTMNSGIAKQIKERFPAAYKADCISPKGDIRKLGKTTHAVIDGKSGPFILMNMYTQFKYRKHDNDKEVYICYDALESALKAIAWTNSVSASAIGQMKIGYPRIGAGKANGDWDRIKEIFERVFKDSDHTLVEYVEDDLNASEYPTSWSEVFNSGHKRYSFDEALNIAKMGEYEFMSWNHFIVNVANPDISTNNTSNIENLK